VNGHVISGKLAMVIIYKMVLKRLCVGDRFRFSVDVGLFMLSLEKNA